ncbi:MAG: hypothetical protein SWX82_28235 [Cyanobacteriota bacterium]|nr:hypothetical protein [Cyanobacteriota bacterium]
MSNSPKTRSPVKVGWRDPILFDNYCPPFLAILFQYFSCVSLETGVMDVNRRAIACF